MTKFFVLAKGAVADLKQIVQYTNDIWGKGQCTAYMAELERAAILVAKGEGHFKDLHTIYPNLRMTKSGHHYIFCCLREKGLPVIIAILHERMDLMTRLKGRLT